MERYKDLNKDSGIIAYEIGSDSIIVEFKGNATYLVADRKSHILKKPA